MKYLGLIRHAKSDHDDLGVRDFDRGLNDRGRRGAALMGRHIAEHDLHWDKLFASPAARVLQTLEASGLDLDPAFDRALYLASAETILDLLREQAGEAAAVLVAAHNPGLQDILLKLVAPAKENALFDEAARKYPTATFAVLELPIDDWTQLENETAELVHFARPRDLDPSLGPEG
ncbi:hypothetical protein HME9302_01601 [Alteripontixanthobacter maritimus]|uniref:Histidine phosphatase family protein n=1 Tax=Alteripontixanthobacter maritimus TaxID=2161824 RepID=A0A369Q6R2_9SPHN|nr:histidine phosphatase family protein [Alteripontixanthobacter maritimus]RDC60394.1 hypothetical protein HME9302_01601 [Alteripontixanthobacter maritimus]